MLKLLDQLPDGSARDMNFYDSSFFKEAGNRLPTPAQVKALSRDIHTSPHPHGLSYWKLRKSWSNLVPMSQRRKHSVYGSSNGPLVMRFQSPRFLGGKSTRKTMFISIWSSSKDRHCKIAGKDSMIWTKSLCAISYVKSSTFCANLSKIPLTSISVRPRLKLKRADIRLIKSLQAP